MPLTAVDAPPSTDSVMTITVQITVQGDELPPAASRLITDLEALVINGSMTAASAASTRTAARPEVPVMPPLRLVAPYPRSRRMAQSDGTGPSLYLCTGSRMLLRDDEQIHLTRREYDLLQFLCEHPRRVFSRAQLLQQVWGYDMVGTERTVDVHIRRVRVKLGDCASVIATVRGVGYRLDDDTPISIVVQPD